LWLWLGDTTGIKRAQDDSVIFGKEIPSSKRLFLAHGFLDGVKARLDPSPFLCPAGIVVVAWRFRGYKKGEGCQAFCLGVLFGFIRLIFP
jgi:hypothetical protein